MTTKSVVINGRAAQYHEAGSAGPAIVFVHGNSFSGRCFDRQLMSSLAERHHLFAVDLPGHGGSEVPSDRVATYSLPGYAAFLREFISALDIREPTLFGWSFGGHIVLEASPDIPDLVGVGLTGAPPASMPADWGAMFQPEPAAAAIATEELSDADIERYTEACFAKGARVPPQFVADVRAADPQVRPLFSQSLATIGYRDEVDIVTTMQCPVLIVRGEEDRFVRAEYLSGLAIPTLWNNEVQVVSGAGHVPFWERPEAVNSMLAALATSGDC